MPVFPRHRQQEEQPADKGTDARFSLRMKHLFKRVPLAAKCAVGLLILGELVGLAIAILLIALEPANMTVGIRVSISVIAIGGSPIVFAGPAFMYVLDRTLVTFFLEAKSTGSSSVLRDMGIRVAELFALLDGLLVTVTYDAAISKYECDGLTDVAFSLHFCRASILLNACATIIFFAAVFACVVSTIILGSLPEQKLPEYAERFFTFMFRAPLYLTVLGCTLTCMGCWTSFHIDTPSEFIGSAVAVAMALTVFPFLYGIFYMATTYLLDAKRNMEEHGKTWRRLPLGGGAEILADPDGKGIHRQVAPL